MNHQITLQDLQVRSFVIPQKTAANFVMTNAVYNIALNTCVYYGDYESCAEMEFKSNDYLMVDI